MTGLRDPRHIQGGYDPTLLSVCCPGRGPHHHDCVDCDAFWIDPFLENVRQPMDALNEFLSHPPSVQRDVLRKRPDLARQLVSWLDAALSGVPAQSSQPIAEVAEDTTP